MVLKINAKGRASIDEVFKGAYDEMKSVEKSHQNEIAMAHEIN